ncbi:low-density lipoprotein receptor-related protein 2-like [Apostichopus japonicus]|uniref:low-density lipoprotein receptor-related protein 2-like n=1 Tax=Stichopus japonicus TaxID=307972 RepID=UPI003AB83692
MNLDGSNQEVIINDFVTDGEDLAIDRVGRYVFWTEFGLDPYIWRNGMDGKGETIEIHGEKIIFPLGLSIDYVSNKLFWFDAHLDYIGYSDFDGEYFHIIPSQEGETYFRPFAVTVFEEFIYSTEWSVMTVFRSNKFTDIPNPCSGNNGGCSHLCLLSEEGGYSCAYPDGFDLKSDGLLCPPNCGAYQFVCEEHTKCIPSYFECDGTVDCADSSDEHEGCCNSSNPQLKMWHVFSYEISLDFRVQMIYSIVLAFHMLGKREHFMKCYFSYLHNINPQYTETSHVTCCRTMLIVNTAGY